MCGKRAGEALMEAIQTIGAWPGWRLYPPPSPEKEAEMADEAVQPAVSPDPGWRSMPGDFDEDGDQRRIVHWPATPACLWVRIRPAFGATATGGCDPAHLPAEGVEEWQDPEHRAAWRDGVGDAICSPTRSRVEWRASGPSRGGVLFGGRRLDPPSRTSRRRSRTRWRRAPRREPRRFRVGSK